MGPLRELSHRRLDHTPIAYRWGLTRRARDRILPIVHRWESFAEQNEVARMAGANQAVFRLV